MMEEIRWRPEGWESGFAESWDYTRFHDFENGAQAMLEALRRTGKIVLPTIASTCHWATIPDDFKWMQSGRLVFIPNDE